MKKALQHGKGSGKVNTLNSCHLQLVLTVMKKQKVQPLTKSVQADCTDSLMMKKKGMDKAVMVMETHRNSMVAEKKTAGRHNPAEGGLFWHPHGPQAKV